MNLPFYLVAGLGKTGRSIAGYLHRRNLPFVVFDTREQVLNLDEFTQAFPGVDIFPGSLPEAIYPQLTAIIASPGIAMDEPVFKEAYRRGIPVMGDIECLAREVTAPVVAITGTNGKSTVTTLVGEMAKAAGMSVAVAGNIGLPVLDLLDNDEPYDLWVLELSSFQLDLIDSLAPTAATLLNITPDHLDRHHSLEAYIAAKQRIYRQAKVVIHNRDDGLTFPADYPSDARMSSYGLDQAAPGAWGIRYQDGEAFISEGENCLIAVSQLCLKGKHNWQNAMAACALAAAIGIDARFMRKVLQTFTGLAHRCQWVRTLDGVEWINDSKGTNIGATISAIFGIGASIKGKIVLIAGGLGKGADFHTLRQVVGTHVRSLVLIGRDARQIAEALTGVVPYLFANSLEQAVTFAKSAACVNDVVLLSPACASQDMFQDFNHRGEIFTQLVKAL